ncbi:MAG: glycosyltransferase family 4 protein [Armatimonas sp.]
MNLLVLSTWHPYPPDNGSRIRAWHLLRTLAKHHRIRLIAGRQDDAPATIPEPLAELCESVVMVPWQWYSGGSGGLRALLDSTPRSIRETQNPALVAAIEAELARKPDVALVMELGMDAHVPETNVPLVLEQAEVSLWSQAKGPRARLTQAKAQRYWQSRFQRYGAITAVSESEAEAIRGVLKTNFPPVHVVPNGVDTAHYDYQPKQPIPGRLIYNGALTYGLNKEAVRWFATRILPRIVQRHPEAKLVVTGRVPEDCQDLAENPHICLTGYLNDIRDALSEASICVVPLLGGGGTRLKVLEAWAAGLPVVSTPVGAMGLPGAENGRELLLAEEADAFADAVCFLLDNEAKRSAVAEAGRTLARTHYDWSAIGERLDTVLVEARG